MTIYHFSRTRFPHQFCHYVTTEVEIGDYLISKVLELIKLGYLVIFFFFGDYWQVNINKKCVYLISKVLELTKLEYLVIFFFFGDYWQININKKCVYLISKILEHIMIEYLVIFFFFWGLSTNKHKHKNK